MQWSISRNANGSEVKYYKYDTQYGPDTGTEYLAVRNADGTFSVATFDGDFTNIPYIGGFDNYREMDEYADGRSDTFVCHVYHSAEEAYVLITPETSYYIRVE